MPAHRPAFQPFPHVPNQYDAANEAAFREAVEQSLLDVAHSHTTKPIVSVTASRSSSAASLVVTVLDYDRRITAIEFNKREGAGAASGWVSSWDSTTGTIGTDASLSRTESISIPAGLDSSAEWRIKFRDQQGVEHVEGGPIPLSNLASVSLSVRISHHGFKPLRSTYGYISALNNTIPSAISLIDLGAALALVPAGSTITAIKLRGSKGNAANTSRAVLYRQSSAGANTALATATITTVGAETITATLGTPELVGSTDHYLVTQELDYAAGTAPSFEYVECSYTAPDYSVRI